jgi:ABC-type bacteriocin/lantibiotic exporter with double-glycine peptidase domain
MNLPKDNNNIKKLNFKYIKIKNLNYTYNYYNKVLSNINLTINKGDKLLLIGNSGSGKSTLVKCISNILDDYEGKIQINDLNLKNINNKTVKDNIVYISQNEKLFVDTIKNNIDIERTNNNISKIYKLCMLDKFIEEKPLKDDTLILEDETNISKGEKARIILARALIKKPKVLIIDETLSSISINYEDQIIKNLLAIKDLTLIYITHRNKNYLFKKVINLER